MLITQDKNRWKYIFKGLETLFLYFALSYFKGMPFILMHINISDIPVQALHLYSLVIEAILITFIYLIYEQEIKLAIKDIKINHEKYFNKYFKIYLLGIIVMMASNLLINKLGGGLSNNESTIRNEFAMYPIFTFVSATFLAPVLEESVFRLGIRSIIKNKILFILASGLIFGGMHLIGMDINILFPLYLLSYSSAGIAFAYMLSQTNNILVPMSFHFMHNGIILSLQFFALLFG